MKKRVLFFFLAMILTVSILTGVGSAASDVWQVNVLGECEVAFSSWATFFSEGLLYVKNNVRKADGSGWEFRCGYIDKTGKVAIPLQYEDCLSFSEGLAGVKKDGKWGFIDKTGKVVIDFRFTGSVGGFVNGVCWIGPTDRMTYIDRDGNPVPSSGQNKLPGLYPVENPKYQGLLLYTPPDLYGYADETGNLVIDYQFTSATTFIDGVATVSKSGVGGMYAFMDLNGNMLTGFVYAGIRGNADGSHYIGASIYNENGKEKWGVIDRRTREVILKYKYDDMGWINDGLVSVRKESLPIIENGVVVRMTASSDGVVDFNDNIIIPFEDYRYISGGRDGLWIVKKGDKTTILETVRVGATPAPTTPSTPPAPKLVARPTASVILVDGRNVAFDAYNINGNNYLKLRDLAYSLNGTAKQFDAEWDGVNNAISLISGRTYTVQGGEMLGKGAGEKTPDPTTSKIYLDGKEVTLTAYNIEGNNYFKLRDIAEAFDFSVEWDGVRNTIIIDTSRGYTPE